MPSKCGKCVVIVGIIIVLLTYGLLHMSKHHAVNQLSSPFPIPFNGTVYLIGPPSLGVELSAAGFPNHRQINASSLRNVPPSSVVAVDWGYLARLGNSSIRSYLGLLLKNHDFIIIGVNGSDALAAEIALVNAWREAFNASVAVVPWAGNGDYVVAAAMGDRDLMIGPATINDLGIKRYEWSEFMAAATEPAPSQLFELPEPALQSLPSSTTGSDVCEYMAGSSAFSGQVDINGNSYFFFTGPYYIHDNQYGIDTDTEYYADFCIAINGHVSIIAFNGIQYPYIPGNTWTWVWAKPGSGAGLNWLSSYQDYYSSYECAKGVVTPDMASVCPINGVTFTGWGAWWGYSPTPIQGQESYDVGIGIRASGIGFTGGVNIIVPPSTITIYTEPAAGPTINFTWVLQPSTSYVMEPNSLDTATSNYFIVNGARTWYPSSFVELAIPMGVSASVNTGGWTGCANELASFRMYWLIFYPQPPPTLIPYYHIINNYMYGWHFTCTGSGSPPRSPLPQFG